MSYTPPTDSQYIADMEAAIARLTLAHKTAVGVKAKRQITAMIKRYQSGIANVKRTMEQSK